MGLFPNIGQWSEQVLQNWIVQRFPQLAFTAPSTPTSGSSSLPGEIKLWPTNTAPGGFLVCNGDEYDPNDDTNSSLYGVIGTSYNTGGETAGFFRVPDLRGRVVVGVGPHADVALASGDALAAAARTPKHSHHKAAFNTGAKQDPSLANSYVVVQSGTNETPTDDAFYRVHTHQVPAFDTDTADFPRLALNYIIAL